MPVINGKLYSKDIEELNNLHVLKKLKYSDKVIFKIDGEWVETTYGRLIIWDLSGGFLPTEGLNKSSTKKLVCYINDHFDKEEAIVRLKRLQDLGFKVATESGVSLNYYDFQLPGYKDEVSVLQNQLLKDPEVSKIDRLKAIDALINKKVQEWKDGVDPNNSLYLMYKSGARVTDAQIRQLLIAKGLLQGMSGAVADIAVPGSLGRGLNGFDYFRTCGPARRGLANNFFVVPASGYFARQLVNCSRDLRIVEEDCGDTEGIELEAKYCTGKYLVSGELVTKDMINEDPDRILQVRSPLTCKCSNGGLCQKCCGLDPATKKVFYLGFGIGTAAAQHLTEPATQLGLRGKHTSGSVNLDEFEHKIDNTLVDIIHTLGAIGTAEMPANNSTSKQIFDFIDEFDDVIEASVEHVKYIYGLYKFGGITVALTWPEVIIRACTNVVRMSDGNLGIRSNGDEGEIVPMKVSQVPTKYPSWLKSLGFGHTKRRLIEAITNVEVSTGCYTEQIISTKLDHFD